MKIQMLNDQPPLDRKLLAKIGVTTEPVPVSPIVDYHVKVSPATPEKPKPLTSDECIKLFGAREAVMMNFIPQMLTALAFDQLKAMIMYCRKHRLDEYKRHNRQLRNCIEEYDSELRASYGRAWYTYQSYLARLRDDVLLDLFKCWCTFTNEASRQYVGRPHKEIAARVTLARMLMTYVEDFDIRMDKIISARIKNTCNRRQNPYSVLISVLCIDIAETFGHKMKITDTMSLCVRVLANRCRILADSIMAEEDAAESAKQ